MTRCRHHPDAVRVFDIDTDEPTCLGCLRGDTPDHDGPEDLEQLADRGPAFPPRSIYDEEGRPRA